jgi:hypothetical protein
MAFTNYGECIMDGNFFATGPDEFADRLKSEDSDFLISGHVRLVGECLSDLVDEGFRPTMVSVQSLQASFLGHIHGLANEAAAWSAAQEDPVSTVAECAAGVICALAVLYELRLRMPPWDAHDAVARLVMAAQMVGTQETLLAFARSKHFDALALFQIEREQASERGRQGAKARKEKAEPFKTEACGDWKVYKGPLSKTAWAQRYAAKYGRKWRTVYKWIKDL